MLYAMKGNRQTKIAEDEKQKFIDQGYKIAELKDNELVFEEIETEESKEMAKLKAESKALKAELKALKEPKKEDKKEDKKEEGK